MTVTDIAPPKVSSWNRQTYQRLKLALNLGLRRQIFLAVCDDLSLRNRLANVLQGFDSPQLVNLNLNVSNPNLMAQIAKCTAQHEGERPAVYSPTIQILGIELLTRQPPSIQRLFLRHLQAMERSLPQLEHNLLLWLPHPWFHTIQQSAPEFWRWHTGVFEFEGEPTPVPLVSPDWIVERPESRFHSKEFTSQNRQGGPYPRKRPKTKTSLHLDADINKQDSTLSETPSSDEPLEDEISTSLDKKPQLTLLLADEQLDASKEEALLEQDGVLSINSDSPASPIEAYLRLGNHYRDRIEQGEASPENLIIAIQAYEQALQNWPSEIETSSETSLNPLSSDVLNDLGNLYWMLSRTPTGANSPHQETLSYLNQAIQAYQLALTKIEAETASQTYAMIQNNLGAAYGDLARFSEPAQNHSQSIRAYQEALRYRRAETEPLKYASTQNNLGTAYWHLAQQQDAITNLNLAVTAYSEALSQYDLEPVETFETVALQWAMIENNLGTTYWNLAQYEQPTKFLQMAVDAYKNALKYRTPEAVPAACSATQNNLGTAYWHLATQAETLQATSLHPDRRREYIEMCIVAYEIAIALAQQLANSTPPVPVNFDMFATCNNLGLAHYQIATDLQFSLTKADKSSHLEAALHNHLLALQGFIPQSDNYQSAFAHIVKITRTLYRECGIQGQNLALSKVPGHLLPEILPKL